ncbi:MAG: hypothetical protein ACKVWV_12455 [Planctomycetota bacterium]
MRTVLPALLLLVPVAQGCVAAALGVGAGVLISQDLTNNNIYVGQLNTDSNKLWASTKTTLSHISLKPIEVDNDTRTATADYDGAIVTVNVETYDLNRSQLKVAAKKYGVNNGDIANNVFNRIVSDLEGD